MTDIFNKLNDIKSKLASLEVNISHEIKKEENENVYKTRMDSKLPKIIKYQNSKVKFNVGNEVILMCSLDTLIAFPFSLSLKEEALHIKPGESLFIDASESLFAPIIEMIRFISENSLNDNKKTLIVSACPSAIEKHSKEYFKDDTEKVISRFIFIYKPFWVKQEPKEKKKKQTNKWGKNDYILCYSCGAQNDGTFWRKRCSYDRADDTYCIGYYIATCMNCDPSNTLTY